MKKPKPTPRPRGMSMADINKAHRLEAHLLHLDHQLHLLEVTLSRAWTEYNSEVVPTCDLLFIPEAAYDAAAKAGVKAWLMEQRSAIHNELAALNVTDYARVG